MKKMLNEGFTLIEVLIAIVVLGLVVVPISSSLVMSFRMNAKTEDLLQAQLAVSSATEVLMAEGIQSDYIGSDVNDNYGIFVVDGENEDLFPDVKIKVNIGKITQEGEGGSVEIDAPYYEVTITHVELDEVFVETQIRKATVTPEGGGITQ